MTRGRSSKDRLDELEGTFQHNMLGPLAAREGRGHDLSDLVDERVDPIPPLLLDERMQGRVATALCPLDASLGLIDARSHGWEARSRGSTSMDGLFASHNLSVEPLVQLRALGGIKMHRGIKVSLMKILLARE